MGTARQMIRKEAGYAMKSPRGRPHDVIAQVFDSPHRSLNPAGSSGSDEE